MKKKLGFLFTISGFFLISATAFAADGINVDSSNYGWYALSTALAIGLPAMGGTLAQGKAAAAALEGIARNPGASGKIFVPMILGMALIESLVLFGLIMAFMLFGKIN